MNESFLSKLFPFIDSRVFSENLLTSYWIIFLISVFFLSSFYLLINLNRIKNAIKKRDLEHNKKLKRIWDSYALTFISFKNEKKTIDDSEDYFSELNIIYSYMNLRFINNIPNFLIGGGILGTFVGLTYGISDSSFETAEEIKNSIHNLLSGMGTAFVTSIWGMGLSLFFSLVFKWQQTRILRSVQKLNVTLDKKYKLSNADLDFIDAEKQKAIINEVFNEYLVAETDHGRQLPKNIFRQLLEESIKQTTSLQSFSDDLGTSINTAMRTIIDDNSQLISKLIQEKLVPVLEDLKKIKQDSGSKVIENAVNQLSESMKIMIHEFKSSITADTKKEFEQITLKMSDVSKSLNNIPSMVSSMTIEIGSTIDSLRETVMTSIKDSNKEFSDNNERVRDLFSTVTNDYRVTIDDIHSEMKEVLSYQRDNISQVSKITESLTTTFQESNEIVEKYSSLISTTSKMINSIEQVSNKFQGNSVLLENSSITLEEIVKQLQLNIDSYIEKHKEMFSNQEKTLIKSSEVANNYVNQFNIIENGLQGIFEQLQHGLKDYQVATAEGLNKYLKEFTSVLTNAVEGLERNVAGLGEFADDLFEQVETLNNNEKRNSTGG